MATVVENDVEYDSDPEEAKRSLTVRRREASDDEEAEGEVTDKSEHRRVDVRSDDLDDEGGVADYDDDDVEGELEEEEEEEEEEVEEEVYEEKGASGGVGDAEVVGVKESDGDVIPPLEDSAETHSEEKKENEPFAVPTAGAFYMHDDRFRDNAGARHRQIHGGKRLWESKDDRKWGHDKFEEITFRERHYEERRGPSKGNYRGSGPKNRGGFVRGNRKGNTNSINHNQVPRSVVRGRGHRKNDPTNKSIGPLPQVPNKQFRKSLEKVSNVSLERISIPPSNTESSSATSKNQVFALNLNSVSPPFYLSGSSNIDVNMAQKREVQTGSTSRNSRPVVIDEGFSVKKNNVLRGKNVVDSISMAKLYIDESISPSVGKPSKNVHMAPHVSSGVNGSQSPNFRASGTGRGVAVPVQMNYQGASSVHKASPTQFQAIQTSSAPGQNSTSFQATGPQLGHRPGSQSSTAPKTSTSVDSHDSGEMDAASESDKAKGALVGKGRGGSRGAGRGSFVYGGAQVMGAAGNVGVGRGDPNFPATPAFLPVMQFGGQHPGGVGVPAVGMAFPGYVAQPQLGLENSEMTWLPVLAGATGALGASYCSPYLAVDGVHTQQSGQTSALSTASKERNVNKANNELKPPQRSELASEELGHRQNKPRRYSEMNFDQ